MIFHARMVSDTGRIRVNKCCICDSDPQTHTRLPRSQKRSAFLTTDRLSDIPGKKFTLEVSVFSAFPMNSVLTHPGQSAVTVMPPVGKLEGKRFGKRQHKRFRGGVYIEIRQRLKRRNGRDLDNL